MSDDQADTVDGAAVAASLTALLARIRRNIELELRVSAPARVIAFDPTTCKATVRVEQLPILDVQGEEVPLADPTTGQLGILLPMIPVQFPRGTQGGLTFPLVGLVPGVSPGDLGRVVFSDRALAAWLQNGNPVAPVDPESGRTHDFGDAVFEPGLMTDADAIAAGPIDMTATVVDGATLVKVGALATEFALTGTTLAATSATIFGVLNAVPNATDPATVITLANANKAAILALLNAVQAAVATKAMVE